MKKKKKGGSPDLRISLFSFAALVLCWICVTGIAFYLGLVLGKADRKRAVGPSAPVYERVGESENAPAYSFPRVLGDSLPPGRPSRSPEAVPGRIAAVPPDRPERSVRPPAETTRTGSEAMEKPGALPVPEPPVSPGWRIQVASFRDVLRAQNQAKVLRGKGYPCFIASPGDPDARRPIFRVFVGPFPDREKAKKIQAVLEEKEGVKGSYLRKGSR